MPGEEVASKIVEQSFGTMGAAAGLLIIILFLIGGLFWLASLWIKSHNEKKEEKKTPAAAQPRITETWFQKALTASDIRAKGSADETQDGRIAALEKTVEMLTRRVEQQELRISECFTVEGKHRTELLQELKEDRERAEKYKDKNDAKNADQDRLINGLSTSFATLQGMIAAKRGSGSGITEFLGPEKKG